MLFRVGLALFSLPSRSTPSNTYAPLSRRSTDSQLVPLSIISRLVPFATVAPYLPANSAERRTFLYVRLDVIPNLNLGSRSPITDHIALVMGRPVVGSIRISPASFRS